jgi:hypothetical protein
MNHKHDRILFQIFGSHQGTKQVTSESKSGHNLELYSRMRASHINTHNHRLYELPGDGNSSDAYITCFPPSSLKLRLTMCEV